MQPPISREVGVEVGKIREGKTMNTPNLHFLAAVNGFGGEKYQHDAWNSEEVNF